MNLVGISKAKEKRTVWDSIGWQFCLKFKRIHGVQVIKSSYDERNKISVIITRVFNFPLYR